MANSLVFHECFFRWDIYDPFLPPRELEATFYHGSPTVTQWKVTLQPVTRGVNNWEFLFSLEFDKRFDGREQIIVRRLLVDILLNGRNIPGCEVLNQRFHSDNEFKYDFMSSADMTPKAEQDYLNLTVQITLVDKAGRNEAEDAVYHRDDLICLSRNLNLLQNDTRYSNMTLIPRNSQELIGAHSYIMNARWNNFLSVHNLRTANRSRVLTNISLALLKDILTYIYSGTFGLTWPDWTKAAYTAELFQVIDRYKLYHLYKVFVKHDMMQFRVTRNSGIVESQLFPLHFINGRPINNIPNIWRLDTDTDDYTLNFQFQVTNQILGLPWLSYSLQSLSPFTVYVKVNMEVIKWSNGIPEGMPLLFHEREFALEPQQTVESRCVLFLGSPVTFGHPGGPEIRYFIRCVLNITDGTTIEEIRSIPDDTLLEEPARFEVLSDHMLQLRGQPVDSDLEILSQFGGNNGENIHKGIFAIRVPAWREGLVNVPPGTDIPATATSTLSVNSLSVVHDYMYTGKLFDVSLRSLREIEPFAERTTFSSLLTLVVGYRAFLVNQLRR